VSSGPDAAVNETEQVLAFVNARLARSAPVRDVELDLMRARIIDSMAMLELVVWLEQAFGLRVRNEDLTAENFRTVAALAGYIRRSRAGG